MGQEKMSSDVEPGDGSGNQGAALPVSPVEYEQGPLVGGPSECRTSDDWTKKLTN